MKLEESKKLILGTAQFGLKYGITNKSGTPSDLELNKIISLASKSDINRFDTASSYGNSEKRLGEVLHNYYKSPQIITKLRPLTNLSSDINKKDLEKIVDRNIQESLKNLQTNSVDTVLLHRFEDIYINGGNVLDILNKYIEKGVIRKAGVSIYTPEEALECMKEDRIKCIQIPFNLVDHRWLSEDFLNLALEREDIEFHIRSIFLQGLLINDEKYWPSFVKNSKEVVSSLKNLAIRCNKPSVADLCISYVKSFKWISGYIVGIDNLGQLGDLISYETNLPLAEEELEEIKSSYKNLPEKLLDPRVWS